MSRQTITRYELTEMGASEPFMWFEVDAQTPIEDLPDGWGELAKAAGTDKTFTIERNGDIYRGASVKAFAA